jgi:hypothetical protein
LHLNQPCSEWEDASEDSKSKKTHLVAPMGMREILGGRASLMVNPIKLQVEVLCLENLGFIVKWYGTSLNLDYLVN